jgi:subtilisin family serine protease
VDGSYDVGTGTSAATPHVAGVAALLFAAAPGATYQQVRDAILGGVDVLPALAGLCATSGRLNARGALDRLLNLSPTVTDAGYRFDERPSALAVAFSENVGASLGVNDLTLVNLTTSTPIPSGNISLSYGAGDVARFRFPGYPNGVLPDGDYRATLAAAGITDASGNPLPADVVVNFFVLAGDATRDRRVNLNDFNVLAANFGQSDRTFSQGDFDYDGMVNLNDFNVLASRFGIALAPASAPRSQRSGLIDDLLA